MRAFLTAAGIVPHKFTHVDEVKQNRSAVCRLYTNMVYVDGLHASKQFKKAGDKLLEDQTLDTKIYMQFLRSCARECETAIFTRKRTINVSKKNNIDKTITAIEYRLLT